MLPSPSTPRRPHRSGAIITKLLIAAGTLAGVSLGGFAILGQSKPAPTAPASGTLELHTASKISFDIATTANGELEAKNSTELRNKLENGQATIIEIIEEGKFAKAGELLIKLNDEDIKNKITEAESQLESAKAEEISARENYEIQLSQNESSLHAAELKLDLARLDLRQWLEGEVNQKRQDNALALERGQRELERTREKHEQSVSLEKQGFLSRDQLKTDEIAYLQAKADLDKAELARKVYEEFQYPKDEKTKQSAVDEAAAELERVKKKNKSELASKEAALENRKRQTTIRDEQLNKLKGQLSACTVTAPKDGLVVYGPTAETSRMGWFRGDGPFGIGSQVYPNQLLIVLPDTSEMVATVKVHESIAGRVKEGLPATIKVEALGGRTFSGAVQSISVLAEQTGRWMDPNLREYTVKIALDSVEDAVVKPSMRCEAELRLGRVEDALSVPLQAVFNEGPMRYVLVPSGNRYAKRPVKIGRRSERYIEIASGLNEGEQVLLRQAAPGEILDRKFSSEELASVGLRYSAEGKLEPIEDPRASQPGKRGPGGRPAGKPGESGGEQAAAKERPKITAPSTGAAEADTNAKTVEAATTDNDPSAVKTGEKPATTTAAATTDSKDQSTAKPETTAAPAAATPAAKPAEAAPSGSKN